MRALGVVRALAVAAVLCVPPAAPAADRQPEERYTLFVEVHQPYDSNRARLQKMLKAEGYESFLEGDRDLTMVLTMAEIARLFQAKVRNRTVEKSATNGMISQPYLEEARIPARFEKLMRRIYFDPQRG